LHTERHQSIWLLVVAAFIFAMVVLGGLVRLTESGLSMVDWRVIMGAVPPLNEASWRETFAAYQQTPQFLQINHQMTLAEFKQIFYMEYFHRLLGRMIGLVVLIPFVFFVIKRRLTVKTTKRLTLLFFLGACQGGMGWLMVKSGLVDIPRVSHFRLTAHLLLAVLVLSCALWFAMELWPLKARRNGEGRTVRTWTLALLTLLLIQLTLGGFVAGLKAGYVYNSFPRMGEDWLPASAWVMAPLLRNFLENPVLIQFMHRVTGIVLLLAALVYAWRFAPRMRGWDLRAVIGVPSLMLIQVVLGILTLLYRVPLLLASLHQAMACVIWSLVLYLMFRYRRVAVAEVDHGHGRL